MNNNNSLMLFDQLATEIIFEIFDYLSCNDIIYAFFDLNERFNSILLQHQRYIDHLETPTKNFYFWQTIYPTLGSEIQCLTINTLDFEFKLDLFPNLKFLIISSSISLNIDRVYSLLDSKEFNKLISLKIQSEIIGPRFNIEQHLCHTIFHHENCLQTFECCSILYLSFFKCMNNLSINENLRLLSLKTYDYTDAFALLEYTPNLKSFKLIIISFGRPYRLHTDVDLSKVKLENIDLTCEKMDGNYSTSQIDFHVFTNFLKQFSSSLIYLSINLMNLQIENVQINGITLQQQLLESLIHLQTFHFYIEQYSDSKTILSTFENQFWFDHQWSVDMHDKYLYTLPFHFNHMKSVNSIILNSSPQTWPNVTLIELSQCVHLDCDFIKQLRIKMPNLRTIIFNSIEYEVNEMDTKLDSVTTICFQAQVKECVQQWLIRILPNVKELIVNEMYHESIPMINERIERLAIRNERCSIDGDIRINDVDFPNVKHLEIQLNYSGISIIKIFNNFKNLETLMLHFSRDAYDYSDLQPPNPSYTLSQINMIEILKQYQIEQNYKHVRFIKKQTND